MTTGLPRPSPPLPPAVQPGDVLAAVRRTRPLVHCITNDVVMNPTANALLAIGASPVMAHAPEEAADFARAAAALVVNLGTLTAQRAQAMALAISAAEEAGRPWVLDPVGVHASLFRLDLARRLLTTPPAVIRGNPSEIAALAGDAGHGRGVDSAGIGADAAHDAARRLARSTGCVVAVTGTIDCVTDGARDVFVHNGHPVLASITGTGCIASALAGACLGAGASPHEAAVAALVVLGIVGEAAGAGEAGPGTAHVRLMDGLAALSPAAVAQHQRLS
jgi:hydroxyethylthiazole kinase